MAKKRRKMAKAAKKGAKKDQAPEEEVTARRASVFDFERRR